jgi:hypothetical protein
MTEASDGFDVRAFTRTAQGRFSDELDLDMFATQPLAPDDRALIRFLARVEGASMEHLRDVLMTATHKDARVTAFLVTWAYEKQWVADALGAVLEAHGEPPLSAVADGRPLVRLSEWRARRGPLWRAVASIRHGDAVVAAHMATGLIDEWVMAAAYDVLADRADNSPLTKVLDRITAVRRRHEEFFAGEADRRLRESEKAVRLTRSMLRHAVWPIGALHRGAADRERFASAVFTGAEGRDRAMAIGTRVAGMTRMTAVTGARVSRILRQ